MELCFLRSVRDSIPYPIQANRTRFGDNFAVLGSILGSHAGNYTLHWQRSLDYWIPIEHKDTPTIDSPVAYGILVIRILVRDNGTDLAEVRQLLDGCDLTEVKCPPPGDSVQPLSSAMFANLTDVSNATAILELTARTLDACPPINITNASSVVRELRAAGVYRGSYHSPANVNLTAALGYALTEVFALAETSYVALNNGWLRLASQGLFGSDYISRAYASYSIPFGLISLEVLYVFNKKGTLSLSNDEAYLYTFSSKPPLGTTGFWSLTMYNTRDVDCKSRGCLRCW